MYWNSAINPKYENNTSRLVILCYIWEKKMSKIQAKKLSLKFVPYLFVAVTILTFATTNGTWVWIMLILVV